MDLQKNEHRNTVREEQGRFGRHLKKIFFLKRSHGNPQTTQDAAKTIGCSLQTDSRVPLRKRMPTQFIGHGEGNLVLTQNLHPMFQCLWYEKVS